MKCPACGRLVSSDLEACPFCREPLAFAPTPSPPRAATPLKCAACGRLAASSFAECPFCDAPFGDAGAETARERARPTTAPRLASPAAETWALGRGDAVRALPPSERRDADANADDDDDDDGGHVSVTTSLAGFLVLALAGNGVWAYGRYDTLVGSGQALGRAAFVVALAVSALVGPTIVRRYEEEPLATTAARIGWLRLMFGCTFATMPLAVPGSLGLYGLAMAANASGTAQTREEVSYAATSVYRIGAQRRGGFKGRGAAYVVRYSCDLRDGVEARGLLALRDEPRVRTGGAMKLVASRGLLGVWLRWGGIVPGSESGPSGRAVDEERE